MKQFIIAVSEVLISIYSMCIIWGLYAFNLIEEALLEKSPNLIK